MPRAHVRFAFRLSPLVCIHHEGHFHKSRKQIATDGHCPNKFLYFGRCACSESCHITRELRPRSGGLSRQPFVALFGAASTSRTTRQPPQRGRNKVLPRQQPAARSLPPAACSLQPTCNLASEKLASPQLANLQTCNLAMPGPVSNLQPAAGDWGLCVARP